MGNDARRKGKKYAGCTKAEMHKTNMAEIFIYSKV
jgi:hypothetical protein